LSYTFPETNTKTVTDISIKTQPAKLTYTHGDTLDLTGLVITLTHDDTTTEDIIAADFTAKNVTATPAQGNDLVYSMHNGQSVKITYGNLTKNTNNLTVNRATPIAVDFNISGIGSFYYDGSPKTVTVTPKEGKSNGEVKVYYEGTGSTTYTKSITAPSAIGTYTVTFDVAEAANFNAASGLLDEILTISLLTFSNIAEMGTYLQGNSINTATTPYYINLNISDLGGTYDTSGSVGYTLRANNTKYVYLYFSGSTITSIGSSAFAGCTSLTSITIPDSVTSIGEWAFEYCTNLTAINVDSNNINYSSDQGVLYNKNKTILINYPTKKIGIFFTIPDSVTNIMGYAFRGCAGLTSITIPNSVTTIMVGAFIGCTGLTSVTIGNGVTSIGDSAFSGCTGLTSITIGNGVTSIMDYAFRGCAGLTSITIPDSVTYIYEDAFRECTGLTSITIPDSVKGIYGRAFSACTSLASVTFEGTITSDYFASDVFGYSNYGFIGDLREKYLTGGIGTYTRVSGGTVWTKQP